MISEGYRTHTGVTGSKIFKKTQDFFGKTCARVFGAPGCHPGTLIDLVNTALASKEFAETICMIPEGCMISEGYKTHKGVSGPMNLKKTAGFFPKVVLQEFWGLWLPSKHLN